MVHGCPLRYYSSQQTSVLLNNYYFSNYYGTIDMSEELMLPRSPSGHNSDSDNSVSSADVPLRETTINLGNLPKKETGDIKCCWQDCGMWFESLERLANHVAKSHASSGPGGLFYCGWEGCPRNQRGFNARYKMLVHVRTHTNEKPHRCNQCEKSFSRAENLKIHSRSHSGEKPYICPVPGCQKAYSNSSDRFKHTRTHQVDKPYMCKVPGCSKRYTDPSSLRKHVKTYRHFTDTQQKLNSSENVNFSILPKLEINLNNVDALSKTTSNERLEKVEVSNPLVNLERVTNIKNSQEVKLYSDENRSRILPVYDDLTCRQSNSSSNYYENTVLQQKMSTQCNCTHTCSMSDEAQLKVGQNDFIQLGSLIDLSRTGINKWDKIWDPFTVVKKQNDNETMDVDLPLDLTVERKLTL